MHKPRRNGPERVPIKARSLDGVARDEDRAADRSTLPRLNLCVLVGKKPTFVQVTPAMPSALARKGPPLLAKAARHPAGTPAGACIRSPEPPPEAPSACPSPARVVRGRPQHRRRGARVRHPAAQRRHAPHSHARLQRGRPPGRVHGLRAVQLRRELRHVLGRHVGLRHDHPPGRHQPARHHGGPRRGGLRRRRDRLRASQRRARERPQGERRLRHRLRQRRRTPHPVRHCSSWQSFKNHPYKVSPRPYASGMPSSFPSYCKIW